MYPPEQHPWWQRQQPLPRCLRPQPGGEVEDVHRGLDEAQKGAQLEQILRHNSPRPRPWRRQLLSKVRIADHRPGRRQRGIELVGQEAGEVRLSLRIGDVGREGNQPEGIVAKCRPTHDAAYAYKLRKRREEGQPPLQEARPVAVHDQQRKNRLHQEEGTEPRQGHHPAPRRTDGDAVEGPGYGHRQRGAQKAAQRGAADKADNGEAPRPSGLRRASATGQPGEHQKNSMES
mmetsp:Transcript_44009/g.141099  ORF Transcript_44009/g.141099 Transcript_44009/m.141099 type:complete len:232 (+) Transcript_44009:640-1335(+)